MNELRDPPLRVISLCISLLILGACTSPFARGTEVTPMSCDALATRSPEFMALGEEMEPGVYGPYIVDQAEVMAVFRDEFRTAGVRSESSGAVRMLIDARGTATGFELVRLDGAEAFGTVLMNMARRIEFGAARVGECPVPSYSEFQFAIRPGG